MRYEGERLIVGVSGGKDSTATVLYLKELGYNFECVFADTGWEHQSTYDYLCYLESKIGKIERVRKHVPIKEEHREFIEGIERDLGFESPFVRLIIHFMCIPNQRRKFCTQRLKIDPIKEVFDRYDEDLINVVGIRREESSRRSKMSEWKYNDLFDCYTWRPIIDWDFEKVRSIHERHNIYPNDLYLNGHSRVGCYPCIYSRKAEIKSLEEDRIDIIEKIEKYVSKYRNKETTFFKNMNIKTARDWSRTSYGGKQFELFSLIPPTCEKWGLCSISEVS